VQSLVEEVRPCHSHAVNTTVGWQDLQRGILQKIYMNKFRVCGTTGQPTQNATYKNANNIYMFQRITSWLLHIIFSFCMIIPQSFQFVGQIVRFVCFLQNVFQTTPLVLQAYLQEAREIVNDTKTFLYGDCPDPGCNCCFQLTIVWGLFSYTRSFRQPQR